MSQTIVTGRGVSTSMAGSQPIIKTACSGCRRTVYLVMIGGRKVLTDPEYIAVVVLPTKTTEAKRINAHRVHDDEVCAAHAAEDERKARRRARGQP